MSADLPSGLLDAIADARPGFGDDGEGALAEEPFAPALQKCVAGRCSNPASERSADALSRALRRPLASFPFIFADQLCRFVEQQRQEEQRRAQEDAEGNEGEGWD